METLFIKLDAESDLAHWVVIDGAGNPHAALRQGSLQQAQDFARQRRIVCVLPGSEVYLNQVILPFNRNRRRYQQATPFALEEELAEDLDDLHFALGKEQILAAENGEDVPTTKRVTIPVAVISRDRLQYWLHRLAAAGIKPHAVIPEILALPWQQGAWSVLYDDRLALVRTGEARGFACDPENLSPLLTSVLSETTDHPQQIRLWNTNGTPVELQLDNEIQIETASSDQPFLATLARGYRKEQAINLLQGEFSYREEYGKLLKPWKVPATLLAALVVLLFIGNTIEYKQLQSRSQELDAQLVDIYRGAFPDARNVPDPRLQMESKLQELAGSASASNSDFLQFLLLASGVITQAEKVSITTLSFNSGRLDIELSLPNVQVLDELKQKLDQHPDLNTEIQSASAEGEQIKGSLRISKR